MTDEEIRPLLGQKAIVRLRTGGDRLGRVFRETPETYRVVSASAKVTGIYADEILAITPATKE